MARWLTTICFLAVYITGCLATGWLSWINNFGVKSENAASTPACDLCSIFTGGAGAQTLGKITNTLTGGLTGGNGGITQGGDPLTDIGDLVQGFLNNVNEKIPVNLGPIGKYNVSITDLVQSLIPGQTSGGGGINGQGTFVIGGGGSGVSSTGENRIVVPQNCEPGPMDVFFIIDGSGSVGAGNFEQLKQFLRQTVMFLGSDVRVGVVQYANSPQREFSLGTYTRKEDIADAIGRIKYMEGGTKTAAAIDFTLLNELVQARGDRPNVQNVVVVITDGQSYDEPKQSANNMRAKNNKVIAIGVTEHVNATQLKGIADNDDVVYQISDFAHLTAEFSQSLAAAVTCTARNMSVVVTAIASTVAPTPNCEITHEERQETKYCADSEDDCKTYCRSLFGQLLRDAKCTPHEVDFQAEWCTCTVCGAGNEIVPTKPEPTPPPVITEEVEAKVTSPPLIIPIISVTEQSRIVPEVHAGIPSTNGNTCTNAVNERNSKELCRETDETCKDYCRKSYPNTLISAECVQDDNDFRTEWCMCNHCNQSIAADNATNPVITKDNRTVCKTTNSPIDLLMVIDGSSSIGAANFLQMKRFLHKIVAGLPSDSRVAAVQYSSAPRTEFSFSTYSRPELVERAVDGIVYKEGSTYTGSALEYSLKELSTDKGKRANIPVIVLVITDGASYDNPKPAADKIRNMGAKIVVLGITKEVNRTQLLDIAGVAGQVYEAASFTQLTDDLSKSLTGSINCVTVESTTPVPTPVVEKKPAAPTTTTEIDIGPKIVMQKGNCSAYTQQRYSTKLCAATSTGLVRCRNFCMWKYGAILDDAICIPHEVELTAEWCCCHFCADNVASSVIIKLAVGGGNTTASPLINLITRTIPTDPPQPPASSSALPISIPTTPVPTQSTQPTRSTQSTPSPQTTATITITPACTQPRIFDLQLVIDGSGSVGNDNFKLVRSFLNQIVQRLPNGSHVGAVQFSSQVRTEFSLNTYGDRRQAILDAIARMPYRQGGTLTAQALTYTLNTELTATRGLRSNISTVVLVITDGQSTDEPKAAAQAIRAKGFPIFVVGVTNGINATQLLDIAGRKDYVFTFNEFEKLDETFSQNLANMFGCTSGAEPSGTSSAAPTTTPPIVHSFTTSHVNIVPTTMSGNGSNTDGFGGVVLGPTIIEHRDYCADFVLQRYDTSLCTDGPTRCDNFCHWKYGVHLDESMCIPHETNFQLEWCCCHFCNDSYNQPGATTPSSQNKTPIIDISKRPIRTCTAVNDRLDLLLVIDGSGSVGADNFVLMQRFLGQLIMNMTDDIRVAAVQYSSNAQTEFSFNAYTTSSQRASAIRKMKYKKGGTNTAYALAYAFQNECLTVKGDRPDVPDAILVITDGRSYDEPLEVSQYLRSKGIMLVAVGVTPQVNHTQLLDIAGSEDGVFEINDFNQLDQTLTTHLLAAVRCAENIQQGQNANLLAASSNGAALAIAGKCTSHAMERYKGQCRQPQPACRNYCVKKHGSSVDDAYCLPDELQPNEEWWCHCSYCNDTMTAGNARAQAVTTTSPPPSAGWDFWGSLKQQIGQSIDSKIQKGSQSPLVRLA